MSRFLQVFSLLGVSPVIFLQIPSVSISLYYEFFVWVLLVFRYPENGPENKMKPKALVIMEDVSINSPLFTFGLQYAVCWPPSELSSLTDSSPKFFFLSNAAEGSNNSSVASQQSVQKLRCNRAAVLHKEHSPVCGNLCFTSYILPFLLTQHKYELGLPCQGCVPLRIYRNSRTPWDRVLQQLCSQILERMPKVCGVQICHPCGMPNFSWRMQRQGFGTEFQML